MASRLANIAAPGSLLKQPGGAVRKKKPSGQGQRQPRERDEEHLDAIRQCPCLSCGHDPCATAAHLRISSAEHEKKNAGIGAKPSDRWTTPLCHDCHMKQHSEGENAFWKRLALDPFKIADALYRVSPNIEAMRAMVFASRAIGGRHGKDCSDQAAPNQEAT